MKDLWQRCRQRHKTWHVKQIELGSPLIKVVWVKTDIDVGGRISNDEGTLLGYKTRFPSGLIQLDYCLEVNSFPTVMYISLTERTPIKEYFPPFAYPASCDPKSYVYSYFDASDNKLIIARSGEKTIARVAITFKYVPSD